MTGEYRKLIIDAIDDIDQDAVVDVGGFRSAILGTLDDIERDVNVIAETLAEVDISSLSDVTSASEDLVALGEKLY